MDLKECQESGKLNLSGFIQKSVPMSETDFIEKYLSKGSEFEVYTEKAVIEFQKAVTDDMVKGNMEVAGFKTSQNDLKSLERIEFMKGENVVGVWIKAKSKTTETTDTIEKGVVTDSFDSYNNKLVFTKTGKEISEQITNILLPVLEAQKVKLQDDLTSISKDITLEPEAWVDEYSYRGFYAMLPKVTKYSYTQCESKWDSVSQKYGELSEEQTNCQKYNQIAYNLVSTMADIQYSTILSRNIDKTKKYELTANQVIALQF